MEIFKSLTKKQKAIAILIGIIIFAGTITLIMSISQKIKPDDLIQKIEDVTQPTSTPKPLASHGPSWNSITPGISSKENIKNQLGEPIKESKGDFETLLTYQSSSATRSHKIYLENQKTIMTKEIVTKTDNKKVGNITEEYGEPPRVLYGSESINGYNLYIYPEEGIAFIGNTKSGTLLEIWYFIPSTFSNFKSKWAVGYSSRYIPRF
jgi:hypothetical protein